MHANATWAVEKRPAIFGGLAFGVMLGLYFGTLALLSGWSFTVSQFEEFWYYILPLAAGFGIQVGLFVRLRQLVSQSSQSKTVVAASGTTSAAAMISCCAHYLVNVAPLLGAAGLVTFAAQFQSEIFWVGLLFNFAGIAYIGNKLLNAYREHQQCMA